MRTDSLVEIRRGDAAVVRCLIRREVVFVENLVAHPITLGQFGRFHSFASCGFGAALQFGREQFTCTPSRIVGFS